MPSTSIKNLGQEQLVNLCEGMAHGTADKLVVAVCSDLAKICKNVKREAKSISYQVLPSITNSKYI